MRECERIIASIEHFYGHMEIECCDSLGLCSVEYKEDLDCRKEEVGFAQCGLRFDYVEGTDSSPVG